MPACLLADGDTRPPPRYLACSQAPCQHECRQVGREYECYCRTGYELLSDGYTCEGKFCFAKRSLIMDAAIVHFVSFKA